MDSPQQKFFVSDDGKEKLSITKAELQAGIDSGKHGEETLAWTKGMSEWLPLSDQSWEKHGIVIEPQPPELPPLTKSSEKTDLNEGQYSAEPSDEYLKRLGLSPTGRKPAAKEQPSDEYLKRLGLSPTGRKPAGTKNFKISKLKQRNKQRHGCLTAYLVIMIIANSATSLTYLVASEGIKQNMPGMPDWAFAFLIFGGILNLACAIALFKWKKWGFWGFVCSATVVFFINLAIGIDIITSLWGLLGIAFLYGVLQIGKERKGWSQLE